MSDTLLVPDILRESTNRLQRSIDEPRSHRYSAHEARDRLMTCELVVTWLIRTWKDLNDTLADGVEEAQFALVLNEIQGAVEQAFHVCTKMVDVAEREAPSYRDKAEQIARIRELTAELPSLLKDCQGMLAWVKKAHPPINPADLPADDADFEAEGYLSLEDILTELNGSQDDK
jgi:hypothetical protein